MIVTKSAYVLGVAANATLAKMVALKKPFVARIFVPGLQLQMMSELLLLVAGGDTLPAVVIAGAGRRS